MEKTDYKKMRFETVCVCDGIIGRESSKTRLKVKLEAPRGIFEGTVL